MYYTDSEINFINTKIKNYGAKDNLAWFHLITTCVSYLVSLYLLSISAWFMPLIVMCIMRFFMIFHDCCHLSYFETKNKDNWNKTISEILEPFVLFEAKSWQNGHNNHHAVNGNKKLVDNTKTVITVNTYENLFVPYKMIYRVLRTPPIFFLVAPLIIFYFNQFLVKPRMVIKYLSLCMVLRFLFGERLLFLYLLSNYIATVLGVMLFHLQHQVNVGYWKDYDKNDKMEYNIAQLHGSSMLVIPSVLKWATFGIEYHHIHHLNTRIPSYNLQRCHENNVHLFNKITKVGYKQAILSLFHTLYDEETEMYISFKLAQKYGLQW